MPSCAARPYARLDDFTADTAYAFPGFDEQVRADSCDEVLDAVKMVDQASNRGRWSMGFVSYDAAPGLDSNLPVASSGHERLGGLQLPLIWFGISDHPPRLQPIIQPVGSYTVGAWQHEWDPNGYEVAFHQVKSAIEAGDSYQCNLTTALTASFAGDTGSFYADLSRAQRSKYSAYIDLGSDVVASASPELFFQWKGETVRTRPMKGTIRRGATDEEDRQLLQLLLDSEKERAENIIVVDLLRNDLSRVAVPGTVEVPALLTAEGYSTVWQLTSDVTAQIVPGAGFVDILRALFPCGSVTGAPKVSTMDLIRRVERAPRGIYCGCIGFVAPQGYPLRAQFSVAIRTAHIDRLLGECRYGVGSGITLGSNCWSEYAELEAKCTILPGHLDRAGLVLNATNESACTPSDDWDAK